MILPDNVVLPSSVLSPICVVDPVIKSDPVIDMPELQFRFVVPLLFLSCRAFQSIDCDTLVSYKDRRLPHLTEKFPLLSNNVLLSQLTELTVLPGIPPIPINILLVASILFKTLNEPVTPNEPEI